ncbi:MAG: exodeoxyribonuclease VII large subunit, partial [Zetaproteobacteria bacterium]
MQPITVSELTARIKVLLERNFTQVAVIGEASNLSARKHLYFTIKDRYAALDAIIWQSTWRRMSIH